MELGLEFKLAKIQMAQAQAPVLRSEVSDGDRLSCNNPHVGYEIPTAREAGGEQLDPDSARSKTTQRKAYRADQVLAISDFEQSPSDGFGELGAEVLCVSRECLNNSSY